VPGDTFGGMASRVDSDVPRNARTVIVQGGYNDLVMGVPAEQSIANMRTILAKLRGRHSNVVLCGFFNKNWDAIGRKLASQYGARFVPGSTCYDPRHRGVDGLHMSASGHQVVAGRLASVVAGRASASKHGNGSSAHRVKGRRTRG
jgi:lysophospholipase L1-like esterase